MEVIFRSALNTQILLQSFPYSEVRVYNLRTPDSRLAMRHFILIAVCLVLAATIAHAAPPKLPRASPQDTGLDPAAFTQIEPLIAAAIGEGQMPGCVLAIGRHGKLVWLQAYGQRQVEPSAEPMTIDTVFDLASLTKPIATATCTMQLVESGQLKLTDHVVTYISDFSSHGKDQITIEQLLTHQSGLIADNSLEDYANGTQAAVNKICELELVAKPGERFIYSDVGFIVLGEVIHHVANKNVQELSHERIFAPLGMDETGFLPGPALQARAAPTEKREGAWIKGEVHDPRSFAMGGVAGHAGLFSTAEDLAVYAQMMINGGKYEDLRILSEESVRLMTEPRTVPGGDLRALGWDKKSGYSSNRGEGFSTSAFGHGGFTGTVLWIDPQLDLFLIFLSNRLHPDGKGVVNPLAGRIGTIAAAAVIDKKE